MDINRLLEGVECTCSRTHTCEIQQVHIGENAIERLQGLCASYRNVLIVADENTYAAAGERTVKAVGEERIRSLIFSGRELLVPDEKAVAAVERELAGNDLILAVGAGVIQDLCKYVSRQSGVPYIVVATAPSMDGYASNGAAMILGGMKVTCPAGLPVAIVADTEVLKNAPINMIKAGYGDIIGKFSALNDWKLSHLVNGEYFCGYIYDRTYEQIQRTLRLAEGLLERRKESVAALMEALITVGILMSFAGSSRPASGSEHHLSHFFEITGIETGTEYFAHGIDVAYSTVVTAEIREKLLARPFLSKVRRLPAETRKKELRRIYGSAAEGCIALQEKLGSYEIDRTETYLEKEPEIREMLSEMPSSEEIRQMLALVELYMDDFYALYGREKIGDAVDYAKDLKDRYTVLWLNYDLGSEKCIVE